jgi:hypothetical protein
MYQITTPSTLPAAQRNATVVQANIRIPIEKINEPFPVQGARLTGGVRRRP